MCIKNLWKRNKKETKGANYEAACSCAWVEGESCGFITSGNSGGLDNGVISKGSNSPSKIKQRKICFAYIKTVLREYVRHHGK